MHLEWNHPIRVQSPTRVSCLQLLSTPTARRSVCYNVYLLKSRGSAAVGRTGARTAFGMEPSEKGRLQSPTRVSALRQHSMSLFKSSHYNSNRPQCTARLWLDWTSAQLVQFTLSRTISHGRVGAQYETVEPAGLSPFKELTSSLSFVQPRRKEGSGLLQSLIEGRLAPSPPPQPLSE